MSKDELIKYLKENLEISTKEHDGVTSEITLYLGDELISSQYIEMPTTDCRCNWEGC